MIEYPAPPSPGEFEAVIMIEVVIEGMVGSD
jgi:hypothetical protein